jgi:hypothetical protein
LSTQPEGRRSVLNNHSIRANVGFPNCTNRSNLTKSGKCCRRPENWVVSTVASEQNCETFLEKFTFGAKQPMYSWVFPYRVTLSSVPWVIKINRSIDPYLEISAASNSKRVVDRVGIPAWETTCDARMKKSVVHKKESHPSIIGKIACN